MSGRYQRGRWWHVRSVDDDAREAVVYAQENCGCWAITNLGQSTYWWAYCVPVEYLPKPS